MEDRQWPVTVGGAWRVRGSFGLGPVVPLLADCFTICAMDRRGRGDSGDAPAFVLEHEVEDALAAIEAPPLAGARLRPLLRRKVRGRNRCTGAQHRRVTAWPLRCENHPRSPAAYPRQRRLFSWTE